MQSLAVEPFVANPRWERGRSHRALRRNTILHASNRRQLTISERIKMVRWTIEDKQKAISKRLAKTWVGEAISSMQRASHPYTRSMALVWRRIASDYDTFMREDRNAGWAFDSQHLPEIGIWERQPANFMWFMGVLMLNTVLPVSVFLCLLLPIYFAWGKWVDWKWSPVALATYITILFKFPPWVLWSGEFFWIWPGVL